MISRITEWRDGQWTIPLRQPHHWVIARGSSRGDYIAGDAADKLAAYEEIGEPDDIRSLMSEPGKTRHKSESFTHNPADIAIINQLQIELDQYRKYGSILDVQRVFETLAKNEEEA